MTIREFHNNFDIEVDKTRDFEFPYILPEQKDYWLNKAQEQFITDRAYPKDRNKPAFEQNQKAIDDLSWIVKSQIVNPVNISKGYSITLPSDYQHLVRHTCTTTANTGECGGTQVVSGVEATHEYINEMLKDPFWTPTNEEPLYYFLGKNIIYETKGNYILNQVELTYIKTPAQMRLGSEYQTPTSDIQCELNPNTHYDILNIAVSMVLENFESQRYQTNLNELNK